MNKFILGAAVMLATLFSCSTDSDDDINPIDSNGHIKEPLAVEAVNLGLSVKWANMNVGASAVTDYGYYYAWGETTPQESNRYDWTSYSLCKGSDKSLTKYNKEDKIEILEPQDDAATANWGGKWRMPTYEELQELYTKCHWEWTANYDKTGTPGFIVYKLKSNSGAVTYSLTDTHIFLPAAGYRVQLNFHSFREVGSYWTSSWSGYCLYFSTDKYLLSGEKSLRTQSRHVGLSVRPVCL